MCKNGQAGKAWRRFWPNKRSHVKILLSRCSHPAILGCVSLRNSLGHVQRTTLFSNRRTLATCAARRLQVSPNGTASRNMFLAARVVVRFSYVRMICETKQHTKDCRAFTCEPEPAGFADAWRRLQQRAHRTSARDPPEQRNRRSRTHPGPVGPCAVLNERSEGNQRPIDHQRSRGDIRQLSHVARTDPREGKPPRQP